MLKFFVPFLFLIFIFSFDGISQDSLPNISVRNVGGQIIVSWYNNYKMPINNINIQRSYDSLTNYATIGSVLNPQNTENGYADVNAPYKKMYYRVFVAFEGGSYFFSTIKRPTKDSIDSRGADNKNFYVQQTQAKNEAKEVITYPSRRIFSAKDNNVAIYLPDAELKKYIIKFFDDKQNLIFELNKIHEPFLILERVNFVRSGWFHFEVYENGKLIEKNKFQILKEGKY